MAKNRIVEIVNFFKESLEKKIHVTWIILFGSQNTEVAREYSDIDLIVVSEDFDGKNIFERAELTKDAERETIRKFLVPLDVMDLTPSELERGDSLVSAFAKDGLRL